MINIDTQNIFIVTLVHSCQFLHVDGLGPGINLSSNSVPIIIFSYFSYEDTLLPMGAIGKRSRTVVSTSKT